MGKKEKTQVEGFQSIYNDYGQDIALVNKLNNYYKDKDIKENKNLDNYKADDIKNLEKVFKKINEEYYKNVLPTPIIEFSSNMRAEVKVEDVGGLVGKEEIEKGTKRARLTKKIMISDRFLNEEALVIYTELLNGIMIYFDKEVADSKIGISGKERVSRLFTGGGIYINEEGKKWCKDYGIIVEEGLYFDDKKQDNNEKDKKSSRRYHFVADKEVDEENNNAENKEKKPRKFYKFLKDNEFLNDQFVCRPLANEKKGKNIKNGKGEDTTEEKSKKLFRMVCPKCGASIHASINNCKNDIRCFNEGCNGIRYIIR